MTQNQLPPDLKKISYLYGYMGGEYKVAPESFSVGTHNTAVWRWGRETFYCPLSHIVMVVTEEKEEEKE